ncbi:MAG: type II secretion system F family protein [Candidatus Taylorbacteria bacterium]|nr:type II secretion system F family protein [Candidatus Taylorbacteria bacterium]
MLNLGTRLSIKDQAAFAKRLAFLIKADVPIIESLKMIKKQTRSRSRNKMFDRVQDDVTSGQFLSASLAKHKNMFGSFAINIIKVGEEGGILDQNLEYLAEELKKRQELKKKILGAMVYPAFITLATIGVTTLITVFIFPKLMPIFESVGANLPLTTKILIVASNFISNHWLFLGLGISGLLTGLIFAYKKVRPFNLVMTRILIGVPIFGHLFQSYQMANLCRTFGTLLNCQVSIINAANITADATASLLYKREVYALGEEITKGRKISLYLEQRLGLFPEMVPQMVAIGETAGNLSQTLLYLSDYYEAEVSDITRNLSNSIEPVLLIVMGLIVGFVAVSVISPIYELTANIHP